MHNIAWRIYLQATKIRGNGNSSSSAWIREMKSKIMPPLFQCCSAATQLHVWQHRTTCMQSSDDIQFISEHNVLRSHLIIIFQCLWWHLFNTECIALHSYYKASAQTTWSLYQKCCFKLQFLCHYSTLHFYVDSNDNKFIHSKLETTPYSFGH